MSRTAQVGRAAPPAWATLPRQASLPRQAGLPIFPDSAGALPQVPVRGTGRPHPRTNRPARSYGQANSPHSPLVGIARLAASAPREREGKGVEYFRLATRTVLNRVVSRRVGFERSINPYRGCEFGCQYCYARYTHEYMELGPEEFERKIYVKDDAARRLRAELTPERVVGTHIAIGAATDPYQPAERRFGVTRAVLETLLEFARRELPAGGLSLSITTKSNLVLKDADLLRELARCGRLHVNLSLTTLNPRLARALEPRAPRPELRLEAVRALNEEGVPAGVFACPVLPGITDRREELETLVAAAKSAGARYLCTEVVFLMPSSQKKFFPFLERKFPQLVTQYRKWYTHNGYAPEAYRRKIATPMNQLRSKHGLPGAWPDLPAEGQDDDRPPRCDQLAALGPGTPTRPQMALPFAC